MEKRQFLVLYREFLFRLVDLDLLPTPDEMTKLLGQLAAMLAAFNLLFAKGVFRYPDLAGPVERQVAAAWGEQHFFIATTMVAVGMLVVLCWDATYPDRRDVMVLAPLPVKTRTMFLAKIAALVTALGMTVLSVNVFTGLSYPLVLGWMVGDAITMGRWLLAYWGTVLAAGAFVMCCVLTMQGLAAWMLPRRIYVRVSAGLQLLAFLFFLSTYFLQPPLGATGRAALTESLPSYWFFGWMLELNGSSSAFAHAAEKARWALGIAFAGAGGSLALTYRKTMRKLVEEPDIAPGTARLRLPKWGKALRLAIVEFAVRTMLRSRQHRLVFALYLGIGLAFALACARRLLYGKGQDWNGPLMIASILVLCCAVLGMRVVMAMPLLLRANWVFRITAVQANENYLRSVESALVLLGVLPAMILFAVLFLGVWPLRAAMVHVVMLGLWGWILVEYCLVGFHKIPFTCSYLPGKANVHIRSGAFGLVLIVITDLFSDWEKIALRDWRQFAWLALGLSSVAAYGRWRRKQHSGEVRFEESPMKDIHALELYRDGRMALD